MELGSLGYPVWLQNELLSLVPWEVRTALLHTQLNNCKPHSFNPCSTTRDLSRDAVCGHSGWWPGRRGTPAFPTGQRSLADAGGLPRARPAHPRTALPPGAPGRGQGTAPAPSRAERSAEFLEGRRPPQTCPPSLLSVTRVPRSAQPQRRQHARRDPRRPGALLQRGQGPGAPRAAALPRGRPPLLLPGLRLRAHRGRAGPPLRVLLRQVRGDRAGGRGHVRRVRSATACPRGPTRAAPRVSV